MDEIAVELGNISKSTLSLHRKRLSKIAKVNGKKMIVKDKNDCDKRTYARITDSEEVEDITKIYEDVILHNYYNIIKKLYDENEVSAKVELALFVKYSTQDYQIVRRDKKHEDNFRLVKDLLIKDEYKYIATYPMWWDVATTEPYMNPHLKRKIYEINLKCHGFDYVFYKRMYEITQELKDDEEFLEIIKKAIKFKEN